MVSDCTSKGTGGKKGPHGDVREVKPGGLPDEDLDMGSDGGKGVTTDLTVCGLSNWTERGAKC